MTKTVRLVVVIVFLFSTMMSDTAVLRGQKIDDTYHLVFSDEFNQPNGSLPDSTKWGCSLRHKSRWARWISNSPDVAYIRNGALVCRAIPNKEIHKDTATMLTGAIETRNKFSFKYGKVEVRLKTSRYRGNFPAAWLLPQPPCEQHPYGGEIDIFESYGTNPHAYHTAHTHWTLHLNKKTTPIHQFHEKVSVQRWHVYSVEWDESKIVWRVDGKLVGTYYKLFSTEAR